MDCVFYSCTIHKALEEKSEGHPAICSCNLRVLSILSKLLFRPKLSLGNGKIRTNVTELGRPIAYASRIKKTVFSSAFSTMLPIFAA